MKSRTKKRLIALGLVLALGAGGVIGLRQLRVARRAETVAMARERGMEAYERGQWQAAMDDLGLYVHRGGRRDGEALYRFADARLRVPEADGSHITLAIAILRDAVAADQPDDRAAPLLLQCYRRHGYWAELLALAEQMERTARSAGDPDPGVIRDLIRTRVSALSGLGRLEEAVAEADRLVGDLPSDATAHRIAIAARAAGSGSPETAIRQYLDPAGGRLAVLGDGLAAEIVRAEAFLLIRDPEQAFDACLRAVADSVPSDAAAQIADLFDVLDGLSDLPVNGEPGPIALAQALAADLLSRPDLSEASRVALVSRNWRAGLSPNAAGLLEPPLADPQTAGSATLGWAILTGAARGEAATAFREELGSRSDALSGYWLAVAACVGALEARAADAPEHARLTAEKASRLGLDAALEQGIALYLVGAADASAGQFASAENAMRRVGGRPGWRIARIEELELALRRGDYQSAAEAIARFPGFGQTYRESILLCEVLVGLGERGRDMAGSPAIGAAPHELAIHRLEWLRAELASRSIEQSPPEVEALLARAHAVSGDAHAAANAVGALLGSIDQPAPPEAAIRLAVRTAASLLTATPELANDLLDFAARVAPDDPDVLYQRALAIHRAGGDAAGQRSVSLLEGALGEARGDRSFELRRRMARLLDIQSEVDREISARAAGEFRSIAEHAPDDLDTQLDVLRSRSAWTDEDLVRSAIARVRAIAGDASFEWRLHEARRLLAFDPAAGTTAQERARTALTEVLAPVVRAGEDPRAFELAARAWNVLGNRAEYLAMLVQAVQHSTTPQLFYPELIAALREAGRPGEAQTHLLRFCELGDVGPVLARDRATLLETFAMFDLAIAQRERLAESGLPGDVLALAQVYARAGRRHDAASAFDRLVDAPDVPPRGLIAAAEFRARTGDAEAGLALLERDGAFPSRVDQTLAVGDYLHRHGSAERAIEHVRRLATSDAEAADRAAAWRWLARSHARRGEVEEVRVAVEAGLALEPADERLLAMRGLTGSQGPSDSLRAALLAVSDNAGGEPMSALVDALAAYAAGELLLPGFIESLTEQTRQWPTSLSTWGVLLQAHALAGDTQAAIRDANRLVQAVDEAPAMEMASHAFAEAGSLASARRAAVRWLEQTPGDPVPATAQLASLDIAEGAFDRALQTLQPHLDAILAADAPDHVATRAVATAVVHSGAAAHKSRLAELAAVRSEWAIACAEAGASMPDPTHGRAWLQGLDHAAWDDRGVLALAQAWVILAERTGDRADAEAGATLTTARDWSRASTGTAHRLRGAALRVLGQFADSESAYRKALEVNPSDWGAAGALAETLLADDRPDEAATAAARLRQVIRDDPTASRLARRTSLDLLARCQIAAGTLDAAASTIAEARSEFAGDPAIESRRMEVAALRGDAREVENAMRAIPADGGRFAAALLVADHLDASSPQAAERVLRTAIRVAPEGSFEYVSAANNLAYLLVVTGGQAEDARQFAERARDDARRLNPPSDVLASILETVGRAQLADADPEAAHATFVEAVGLTPDAPDALLGLAESLRSLGRDAEADQVLARIEQADRATLTENQRVRYERLSSADGS